MVAGDSSRWPNTKRRAMRAGNERSTVFSISARAASTSLPYSTPEGQALSQPRQARHSSICSIYDGLIGAPAATCAIW